MERSYLNLLSRIIEDKDLSALIPSKIVNFFLHKGMSLLDVYRLSDEEVISYKGFGTSKLEVIHDFQLDVENNRIKFLYYYKYNVADISIPFHYKSEESIDQSIFKCLSDYTAILYKRNIKNERDISIISSFYGLNGPIKDLDQIALRFNLTKERVRLIIQKDYKLKELFQGENIDNIHINNELIEKINHIKNDSVYTTKFHRLIAPNGILDYIKLVRIANLLSTDLVKINDNDLFLVLDDEFLSFKEHFRAFIQELNKEVLPLLFEDIQQKVCTGIKKIEFRSNFIINLLNDHQFVDVVEIDDQLKYQLKWQFLSSFNNKAKRILYENGDLMSDDDILEEYNKRCRDTGADEISKSQMYLQSDEHLKSIGKSGYWFFLENPEEFEVKENVWTVIENFLRSNNGKAYFSEIKDDLIEKNYNYSDVTLRTYILKSSLVSVENANLFVHLDFIDRFPEIKLKKKQQPNVGNSFIKAAVDIFSVTNEIEKSKFIHDIIEKLAANNIIISKGNASLYIKKFINIEIIIEIVQEGLKVLSLDNDQISNYDLEQLGKQKEPEYRRIIRSQAISYLKENDTFCASLEELWVLIADLFPNNISKSNFYKIFNDSNYFEKYTENNCRFVRLRKELLPDPKDYTEEVNVPTEPTNEQVADIQLETLRISPPVIHVEFNRDKLIEQFKKELIESKLMDETMIQLGLDTFFEVFNNHEGKNKGGEYLLQSIYKLWFTKTDFYDRDVCFQKLTTYYEEYLRKLCTETRNTTGLQNVISSINVISDLKNYKYIARNLNFNEVDKQKKSFSIYLNTLIYFRNLYSHDSDNEDLDMGLNKQMQNITNFISLYIYTSYLLNVR
jgi:hypothetical protein